MTFSRESAACETVIDDWSLQPPSRRAKDAGTPQESSVNHQTAGTANRWIICVQTDTNMTSDLLTKVTTSSEFTVTSLEFEFQIKLLKIPKILPVWPQITQTGTNTECFPNIPQTLQNKHWYQMQSALLLPADVFIKSNANKILLQLRTSTEKHLH